MASYLNIGVSGQATWPTKETKINFGGHELILRPATKETEQSVHIDITGIDQIDALTLINRFLSHLAWCSKEGMENDYGWSGNPVPASVPRKARMIGSSIGFPFSRKLESDHKNRLAMALYRESLINNSQPYQFLGFFKILNIIWKDKYKNGANEIIEGLRLLIPDMEVSNSELKARLGEIRKLEDPATYLYQSCRCAVAHANTNPVIDPDDVHQLRRLSTDLPLIREAAEIVMKKHLKIDANWA